VTRIEKDLPDPLETSGGASASDPDELVAQLAEDAIDRLLEETEKGLIPPRPKPQDDPLNELEPSDPSGKDSVQGSVVSDPTDGSVQTTDPSVLGADKGGATSSVEVHNAPNQDVAGSSDILNEVQEGLGSVLGSLGGQDVSENTAGPSDSTDNPVSVPVENAPETSLPMPPPVDVPPEIANDDGHGGSDESSESVSGDPTESTDQSDLTGDVRKLLIEHPQASSKSLLVSVLLVPLKLVNAPFTGLSDQTRDVLGQIGLITLVNALAILVYVLIFR
jgi:hypothetical protein